MITFSPIARAAPAHVEALLDAAFGTDRHQRTAYRLREGLAPLPDLSFAAFAGEALVATLQSWPIELAPPRGGAIPLILVGPIAVRPDRQHSGIGKALTGHALAAIDAAGERAAALIGDPEYYDRLFGFSAAPTRGWEVPGPVERRRLLVRLTGGQTLPAEGILRPAALQVARRMV